MSGKSAMTTPPDQIVTHLEQIAAKADRLAQAYSTNRLGSVDLLRGLDELSKQIGTTCLEARTHR